MKIINLRDYYPFYNSDNFIEISDEIFEILIAFAKNEHAYYERRRVNKAYYSLDTGDGIEQHAVIMALTPQEIVEQKFLNQELYKALSTLPEKQAKRICAYFFLGMSKASIARAEGIDKTSVKRSIERGLRNIANFVKEII